MIYLYSLADFITELMISLTLVYFGAVFSCFLFLVFIELLGLIIYICYLHDSEKSELYDNNSTYTKKGKTEIYNGMAKWYKVICK